MANTKFYGTGRRKKSIARVYLVPGTGKITINKRDIDEYLGLETLKLVVRQPLVATETVDKFDVLVNVRGDGNGICDSIFSEQPENLLSDESDHGSSVFVCILSVYDGFGSTGEGRYII